jgi:hypothetical protein
MAIADNIISEVRKKPGLTAMEIAVNIFGRRSRYNAVHEHAGTSLIQAT